MKQQEEILRKRISLRRLPHEMEQRIDQTVDRLENQLANPVIDKDERASLGSACSKLITQYKFDLMCLNLQIIQHTRRSYQKLLATCVQELSQTSWSSSVKQAIIDRQNQMVERHESYLKHKLNTFFVEAPMV